jgi:hypothetical protein
MRIVPEIGLTLFYRWSTSECHAKNLPLADCSRRPNSCSATAAEWIVCLAVQKHSV